MNQQTLKGQWSQLKGRVKEKWGQLTDDDLSRTEGNVDQLVGLIQRKTGEARTQIESFLDDVTDRAAPIVNRISETAQEYVGAASETIRNAAGQAYGAAQAGLEQTQQMVRRHPRESLGASFGAGLVAGVIIGLIIRSR